MESPRKLLDAWRDDPNLGPIADEALSEGPSADALARLTARAEAVMPLPPPPAAAPLPAAAPSVVTTIVAVAAAGGLALMMALGIFGPRPAPEDRPTTAAPRVPASETTERATPAPVAPVSGPTEAIEVAAPAPSPAAEEGRVRRPRRASAEAAPVRGELEILDEALHALRSRPSEALAATEEHRRDHARGELAESRERIAIEALLRLGRHGEAVTRWEGFVARYPSSVFRARLEQLVEQAAEHPTEGDSTEPTTTESSHAP